MASRLQPGAPFSGSFFSTFGKSAKGSAWGGGPLFPRETTSNLREQWPSNKAGNTAGCSEAPGSPENSRSRPSSWVFEGTGSFWNDPFAHHKKGFSTPSHGEPSVTATDTSDGPVSESGPQTFDPVEGQGTKPYIPTNDEISKNGPVEGEFVTPGAAQAAHRAESTMLVKRSAGTHGAHTSPPPQAGAGSPPRNRAHFHGDSGSFFQDHWKRGQYGGDAEHTSHAGAADRGCGRGQEDTEKGSSEGPASPNGEPEYGGDGRADGGSFPWGELFGSFWRGGGFGGIGFGNQFDMNDPARRSGFESDIHEDDSGNSWTDSRETVGAMFVGNHISIHSLEKMGVSDPAAVKAVDTELMTTGAARIKLRCYGDGGAGRPAQGPDVDGDGNVCFDAGDGETMRADFGATAFNTGLAEQEDFGRWEGGASESVAGQRGGAEPEAAPSDDCFGAARPPFSVQSQEVGGFQHELQHDEVPSVGLGKAGIASFFHDGAFTWDDPQFPSGLVEGRTCEAVGVENVHASADDGDDADPAASEPVAVDRTDRITTSDAPLAAGASSRVSNIIPDGAPCDSEPFAFLPAWMELEQWPGEDTVEHPASDILMDAESGMRVHSSSASSTELPSADTPHSSSESAGAVLDIEVGKGDGWVKGGFPMGTAVPGPELMASGTSMGPKGDGSDTDETGVSLGASASGEGKMGGAPPDLTMQEAVESSGQPAARDNSHVAEEGRGEARHGTSRPADVFKLVVEQEARAPMEDQHEQTQGIFPEREVGRNDVIDVPVPLSADADVADGGWLAVARRLLVEALERTKGFLGFATAFLHEAFSCGAEEHRRRGYPSESVGVENC